MWDLYFCVVNRNNIRLVIILGAVCLAGITVTQVYWMLKVFDVAQTGFDVNVSLGLKNVSDSIAFESHVTPYASSPVTRLTSNYFVVRQIHNISPELLERYLKNEFAKRGLQQNFGLVMYRSDKLVYSKCITFKTARVDTGMLKMIPNQGIGEELAFGIYFPSRSGIPGSVMYIWIFSSVVLLGVILFFAYAMLVILKQKKLSDIQRDFVNNMAHEFQTPISAIMASAEVLRDPAIYTTPQRLSTYTGIVEAEINKLHIHVQRILEMAGAESVEIVLKRAQVNVHASLAQTIEQFIQTTGISQNRIRLHLNAKSYTIFADPVHFVNIIYNLVDNAFKYSAHDSFVEIFTSDERNGIVIAVKDQGIGIAGKEVKKIFNKFYRVSQGNRHDVKGFGLGLGYVKLMVDAHRGTIDVNSRVSEGTTFILFFPFK